MLPRWNVFAVFPFGLIAFLLFFTAGIAETNRARSTSRKPNRNWWPATTPNTARCASPCSSWPEMHQHGHGVGGRREPVPGRLAFPRWCEGYGWIMFLVKLAALLFFYLWLRWTLPRVRYDQLMSLGWKVLLPIATLNLLAVAAGVIAFGL
ncbi:MAG: NADH-quinone oxidoreductase subunit H [Vicinamibacterales bacterium]